MTENTAMEYGQVVCLREQPSLLEKAACWFSDKWGIPTPAYRESMSGCISRKTEIPQWYIVLNEEGDIIAGAGVIENDFHDRKDLTPNLCALFVEEAYRGRGIAKAILGFVRSDLKKRGIFKLYLVTEHTAFYEKCGWEFLTMAIGDDRVPMRLYAAASEATPLEADKG